MPLPVHSPPDSAAAPSIPAGAERVPALEEKVRRLEQRLADLEQYVGWPDPAQAAAARAAPGPATSSEATIESQIGELWLARIGVVALIVGLGFLVTYPFATLPPLVPCLIGYAAVAAFLVLSRLWRSTQPETAGLLFTGALFLAYFATLRLHFFSAHPALPNRELALALLVAVLAAQYAVAFRRGSEWTAGLAAVLAFVTGIVSDTPNFSLALAVAAAVVAAWLHGRRGWWRLLLASLVLAYTFHLLWLLNNPLAGRPFRGVDDPHANLLFLAAYAVAFALSGLLRPQEEQAGLRIVRAGLNCGGAMLIGLLNIQLFHRHEAHWVLAGLAGAFLVVAVAYWWHHRGPYGTAIHACFGYMALSGAIVSWFHSPAYFGWLAWQGLLVAATAVWFRSKIIVVANLFIFGGIYLAYLALAPVSGWVNLSFAIVSLLTARILNWQQQKLELRTEAMRNTYLAAATIIIPYGLYHTVAKSLVSSSWLAAAAVYFLASLLLRNRKYRWMAIATVLATIGYVFVVDLSRLEPAYRIISFLILGVALLVISVCYARQRRRLQATDGRG